MGQLGYTEKAQPKSTIYHIIHQWLNNMVGEAIGEFFLLLCIINFLIDF